MATETKAQHKVVDVKVLKGHHHNHAGRDYYAGHVITGMHQDAAEYLKGLGKVEFMKGPYAPEGGE